MGDVAIYAEIQFARHMHTFSTVDGSEIVALFQNVVHTSSWSIGVLQAATLGRHLQ